MQSEGSTRTIVVGLGNPVLGDDAVGWRVVEALGDRLEAATAELDSLSLGGLRLMERLVGYDRAIVVDAIVTGDGPPGSVTWRTIAADAGDLAPPTHTGSAHDTSLETALRLGRALGAPLPSDIRVLTIEAGPCFDFGEELTPAVATAVPVAVERLVEALGGPAGGRSRRVRSRTEQRAHRHWKHHESTDNPALMAAACAARPPRGGIDG